MSDIDVVIVGGGVAGSSAALTAARDLACELRMPAPDGSMGALAAVDHRGGRTWVEGFRVRPLARHFTPKQSRPVPRFGLPRHKPSQNAEEWSRLRQDGALPKPGP